MSAISKKNGTEVKRSLKGIYYVRPILKNNMIFSDNTLRPPILEGTKQSYCIRQITNTLNYDNQGDVHFFCS